MPLTHDYHVHSTYSDGSFLVRMVRAAEEVGLDGVGFADHCNVSAREPMVEAKCRLGFNLDRTYERRRRAIEALRERADVRIFDAVEMDYDPADESEIRAFLDRADFDYAVGSVHFLDGVNVHSIPYFAEKSEAERRAHVDRYFEKLVALVDSELFEIAAHVDLVERNPALRGLATPEHYDRVGDAFERSSTVPEVNAGRILREYGEFHPAPPLLGALLDRGVSFTVGSDAHRPDDVRDRAPVIETLLAERDIEPARLV
ncbi:PHP domain-containing protein [Halegenticoccus tardaugens]|uniref:PHP domain-containing protein n=1 Tax=Halegenticoccus tardaugens TaxID=2071624 RepID=UPI001E327B6C|nr:PHP domain-containing protein [Halegenticoccus tardaugens]